MLDEGASLIDHIIYTKSCEVQKMQTRKNFFTIDLAPPLAKRPYRRFLLSTPNFLLFLLHWLVKSASWYT